jgi:hypothetical protein
MAVARSRRATRAVLLVFGITLLVGVRLLRRMAQTSPTNPVARPAGRVGQPRVDQPVS